MVHHSSEERREQADILEAEITAGKNQDSVLLIPARVPATVASLFHRLLLSRANGLPGNLSGMVALQEGGQKRVQTVDPSMERLPDSPQLFIRRTDDKGRA